MTASVPRKVIGYQLIITYPVLDDSGAVRHMSPQRIEYGATPLDRSIANSLYAYLKAQGVSCTLATRYEPIVLDYSQIEDVCVNGIDYRDSPDFVDAYIESASYMGRDMTDDELDALNEDSSYVYEAVQSHLY